MNINSVPRSFILKGHEWKVRTTRDLDEDANGETDSETRTIKLRTGMKKALRWNIFLHEFFHAVVFELHLSEPAGVIDSNTEEILVTGLADILQSTFELKWNADKAKGIKDAAAAND